MSDTTDVAVNDPLRAGHLTSEGKLVLATAKLAQLVTWLGAVATAVTALFEQLQVNHISYPWMGPVMAVAGVALKTALAWGYGKQRAMLKGDVANADSRPDPMAGIAAALGEVAKAGLLNPSAGPLSTFAPLHNATVGAVSKPLSDVLIDVAKELGVTADSLHAALEKTDLKWMVPPPESKPA